MSSTLLYQAVLPGGKTPMGTTEIKNSRQTLRHDCSSGRTCCGGSIFTRRAGQDREIETVDPRQTMMIMILLLLLLLLIMTIMEERAD